MYDVIAEVFVYAFALAYAALFVVLAEKWLRAATKKNRHRTSITPPLSHT
jgi:hypothetical protein